MAHTLKLTNGTKTVQLNWQRQPKDIRDEKYRLRVSTVPGDLPSSVDNRNLCSPIRDQGQLGSCTAFSVSALVESNANAQLLNAFPKWFPTWARTLFRTGTSKMSTLFQYYASRVIEGTVPVDSGATLRGALKAVANFGAVAEAKWPYNISKFATNPPANVWAEAKTRKARSYHPIADGDVGTMKALLAQGKLICFGFLVFDAMLGAEVASTGLLPLPASWERIQGGHAVTLVGYDDDKVMPDGSKGAFLVRNSWGTGWGQEGYYWMPYAYVGDPKLASDFWTIQPFAV